MLCLSSVISHTYFLVSRLKPFSSCRHLGPFYRISTHLDDCATPSILLHCTVIRLVLIFHFVSIFHLVTTSFNSTSKYFFSKVMSVVSYHTTGKTFLFFSRFVVSFILHQVPTFSYLLHSIICSLNVYSLYYISFQSRVIACNPIAMAKCRVSTDLVLSMSILKVDFVQLYV